MEINTSNDSIIGETGIVDDFNHNSQTILLDHNYSDPVIFAQPLSYNGSDAAIVRIEDVKSDRFTAFLQEPDSLDGKHVKESFSYLVLEKGTWQLEDDTLLEVGTVDTNRLSSRGFENVDFTNDFSDDPLVFSQVQTDNGKDFVNTRQRNTSTSGFQITMQEEEARNNYGHANETVGWFAIDAGNGDWSQNNYLAGQTGDRINQEWKTVDFKNNFSEPPIFLASTATFNGGDPVALRYSNLSNNRVQIKLQEDTSQDAEIYHPNETVSFLAIAGNNSLRGVPLEEEPSKENSDLSISEEEPSKENSDLSISEEEPSKENSDLSISKENWDSLVEKSKTDKFIQYNQQGPGPRVNFNRTLTWEANSFEGDYIAITERPDAKALTVHVDATGGFAGYVNEFVPQSWDESLRLDDVHQDVTIEGRVEHNFGDDISNGSRWATGPKVSAIGESGWYENYIVENSSWTPEEYHEYYTEPGGYYNAEYLGETYHDGSVYKHYSYMHPAHGKWRMFWAIRQDYRESGEVHIAPILEKWRDNGMKNGYLDWVEYNMELFGKGPWEGTMKISDFETTDNWKTGK